MKAIYFYDSKTKLFTSVDIIDDSADLPENSTTIQPINEDGSGMYDPKWDGKKWVSLTKDEFDEAHKDDPEPDNPQIGPSDVQRAITALAQQLSTIQEQNEQLQKAVTAMAIGGNQ